MIDLLVAGAGPVGLVTAINAALQGLEVTVVEPREGAIDKACGEGLMPDALARLARIGVDPPGVEFTGIRYVDGDTVAEARFSAAPGRGVRRTVLHDELARRARDVGVQFVEGRVDDLVQDADGVEAAGVRARYIVGADGLHSHVRRALGLAMRHGSRPRFGVRQHFATAPWTDMVEVHWLPDAEVYVTPVAHDVVGIAVLGEAPLHFDATLARLPHLIERVASSPHRQRSARRGTTGGSE